MTKKNGLPDGWCQIPVGKILPINYGIGLPQSERNKGNVPVYGSNGVVGNHSQSVTKTPCIIIGRKGAAGSVHFSESPCWPIDTTYYCEGTKSTNLTFFYYLLNNLGLNALDRSTAVPSLSRDDYNPLLISVPPESEQRRIVSKIEELFSKLDAGVAALERAQANLKRYRASVLKAAVEGKLTEDWRSKNPVQEPASKLLERILVERRRKWEEDQMAKYEAKGQTPQKNWKSKYKEPAKPDTSNLPELPKDWCWATVNQIGAIGEQAVLTGPFGTSLGRSDFISDGIPVITIGCLTEAGINLKNAYFVSEDKAKELERYRLLEGDILFSRMATVGRAGYVSSESEGALINYHIMRLRLSTKIILPKYFIAYVRGARVVNDHVKTINHGATRDGINTNQLLELPIALPPLVEQKQMVLDIDEKLSDIQQDDGYIKKDIIKASRLRQSILKQAFEGKLVPQDPNDEPAEKLLERIRAERALNEKKPKTKSPKSRRKSNKGQGKLKFNTP